MTGQGSPTASLPPPARIAGCVGVCAGRAVALLAAMLLLSNLSAAADETMQVRIAFGGGGERLWYGSVSLSQGVLSGPTPLGIEADEPGSMWIEQGQLKIRQRSARAYDGVDVEVRCPADARLLVDLTAADDPQNPIRIEVPLAEISDQFFNRVLDNLGNRLLVRRTPGDRLRVSFARDALVFSPGEKFHLTLQPHELPVKQRAKIHIDCRLQAASDGREVWSALHKTWSDKPAAVEIDLEMPTAEGVYDLVFTAKQVGDWKQAVRAPLNWNPTVAERRIQVLVLDTRPPVHAAAGEEELSQAVPIDPTNPRWWELLSKLQHLPKNLQLLKGPLGNDSMEVFEHTLGKLVRLKPSDQSADVSWEAYRLPIDQPGRPHVLEVEYPSDVRQTLGISILEPNAAGALMPIGLDSGVDSADASGAGNETVRRLKHRLIFWPRTNSPMVLITNLRGREPAVYGKIRVMAGWSHLPPAPPLLPAGLSHGRSRLLSAYLDRPLFPENFSATERLDPWSGRSFDDWQTFYEGGTRLVEYLRHVGYNGLMISVLADGSTIYPSAILQPTPRYDTGVFFATGQDPVRKDVLEMLLRQFDRQGMQLIPTLDFSAPLPELEEIRREGGPTASEIQWVGPDGHCWSRTHAPHRGLAPYYNTLHPRVQEAMLAVVQELLARYGHHPALGGLAIRLSGHGYAQLPGPQWGMDDVTVARFEKETDIRVPGTGAQRFAQRAAFLLSEKHRPAWIQWRCKQLGQFHRRIQEEVARVRPGGRLYLAAADAFSGPALAGQLRPALPRQATIADALRQIGIDAAHYGSTKLNPEGIILLRPERISPGGRLGSRAVDLEIGQMPDVDRYFNKLPVPGSLFVHTPNEIRIESFDRKSPFPSTYTWLVSQPVPSDRQNRRRFAHSLATLDPQVLVDGGWMLPLGQEDSLRDLIAVYRRLPAVPFRRAAGGAGDSAQPVSFRYATHARTTYAYAVNDSPFAVTARVRVDAPAGARLQELTGRRRVEPLKRDAGGGYWTVELRPYDVVAVQLSQPNVRLFRPTVSLPPAALQALGQRIHELGARAAWLRNPPPPLTVLTNPGFEKRPAAGDPLPGWNVVGQAGVTIVTDARQKHGGKQSVRMTSTGPPAYLASRPFPPPATGRLSMSVWLRVADAKAQPPLRLAVEGKLHGRNFGYYRFAPVGRAPGPGQARVPIAAQWTEYVFPLDDLPLKGLTDLHVAFELTGPGEVWIDDVQLFDLVFHPNENIELSKLITLADVTLQNGQVSDCMRLLDGYWPQFLMQHVPAQANLRVAREPDRPAPDKSESDSEDGFFDRMKGLLPKKFW